ncbi:hypothetical protein Tco_1387424 [Tanacetum coccineum]
MESIKKEAHLIKVQWNGGNKYQVSGSFGDQCVVDVVTRTCSCENNAEAVVVHLGKQNLQLVKMVQVLVLEVKVHPMRDGQKEEYKQNVDGREMGDDITTQSSEVGGASEWSFM